VVLMIQKLAIPKELRQKFQNRAEYDRSFGEEVCGVMIGTSGNLSGYLQDIRMIKNVARDRYAGFIMDPEEFLKAVTDTTLYAEEPAYNYLGIIHSHYSDKPYPSIVDWCSAVEKGMYHGPYVIYSVPEEKFNGFYWNGNEFLKMELL